MLTVGIKEPADCAPHAYVPSLPAVKSSQPRDVCTTLKFSALRTKKPLSVDNARTQILDCHLHFRQFPSAKIAQMLETAKLNGNILHVDSLCLTLYCFRITYYFENSFCSIGSCFRNKMRSFSRRFRSRRLCFPFHLWKKLSPWSSDFARMV